jgi:acyl-CoA synthetase (AMP-forming)/AMP-acid ligase II
MYGQTEATARVSYVPFEQLGRKIGSVGIPVPGGSLAIDPATGELIYFGPNVMLGYAQSRQDLAKGDELRGELRTGDIARKDDDGYFYIIGRLKRFLKMFGKRFNLDDVERIVSQHFGRAVACYGRDDFLVTAMEECEDPGAVSEFVCGTFDLPRTAVRVASIPELPRTANGKVDHHRLTDVGGPPMLAAAQ